jgi:hypothetical protein
LMRQLLAQPGQLRLVEHRHRPLPVLARARGWAV